MSLSVKLRVYYSMRSDEENSGSSNEISLYVFVDNMFLLLVFVHQIVFVTLFIGMFSSVNDEVNRIFKIVHVFITYVTLLTNLRIIKKMLTDHNKMEFRLLQHLQASSLFQLWFVDRFIAERIVHGNVVGSDLYILWPLVSRAPMKVTITSCY